MALTPIVIRSSFTSFQSRPEISTSSKFLTSFQSISRTQHDLSTMLGISKYSALIIEHKTDNLSARLI